jgi:hypothetical protein
MASNTADIIGFIMLNLACCSFYIVIMLSQHSYFVRAFEDFTVIE